MGKYYGRRSAQVKRERWRKESEVDARVLNSCAILERRRRARLRRVHGGIVFQQKTLIFGGTGFVLGKASVITVMAVAIA
jgi:hypothetical protein